MPKKSSSKILKHRRKVVSLLTEYITAIEPAAIPTPGPESPECTALKALIQALQEQLPSVCPIEP